MQIDYAPSFDVTVTVVDMLARVSLHSWGMSNLKLCLESSVCNTIRPCGSGRAVGGECVVR